MKRIIIISCCLLVYCTALSQEENSSKKLILNTKLDLHSSHLWRGYKNGNSFSVQPTLSVSKGSLNFGAWAAYAGDDSYFEIDLFAEYTYKSLTFSLYDYYCPKTTQMHGFFEFRKSYTRHTLDAMISWNPENLPFKILASTFILGDDISPENNRQAYSTYIEPAITWKINKFSGDILFGFTPYAGYYSNRTSIVNLGASTTYDLSIKRFKLPINSKISYNPVLKSFYYSVGFTVSPM